ncbi:MULTISPECIES: hypothetical protein [unclassified Rhizobium]|uniref:hypothetical protein n=1 Tax=unclassified Rhizobium TaxID=2613769 RepID=UPI00247A0270|nr:MULTISPECIES: hypothetical protein [unclassified Rhizobium]MDH7801310.1 hypothetical protein [Rhizobium sp. AN70]
MMDTSLQAPNRHIHDRSAIDAMTAEWIAKNGEPRKFENGFCTDLDYLKHLMSRYGYNVLYHGHRFFSMEKADFRGSPRRISHEQLFKRIDAVLIKNGKQPFGWRKP